MTNIIINNLGYTQEWNVLWHSLLKGLEPPDLMFMIVSFLLKLTVEFPVVK